MWPILIVLAALGYGGWKIFGEHLDKEHEAIYRAAVKNLVDPAKLRQLAQAFEQIHYPKHAKALLKLADLHEKKPGQKSKKNGNGIVASTAQIAPSVATDEKHEEGGLPTAGTTAAASVSPSGPTTAAVMGEDEDIGEVYVTDPDLIPSFGHKIGVERE